MKPRRSLYARGSGAGDPSTGCSSQQARSPAGLQRPPGLEPDQPTAALKCVGRAGHRLDSQTSAPAVWSELITRIDLDVGVVLVDPQLGARAVGPHEARRRDPVIVAGEVREGGVDALLTKAPRDAKVDRGALDERMADRQLAPL